MLGADYETPIKWRSTSTLINDLSVGSVSFGEQYESDHDRWLCFGMVEVKP